MTRWPIFRFRRSPLLRKGIRTGRHGRTTRDPHSHQGRRRISSSTDVAIARPVGTEEDIKERFVQDVSALRASDADALNDYSCLAILEPEGALDQFDLDRVFEGLESLDPELYQECPPRRRRPGRKHRASLPD